jgi:hypothetical protein
VALASNATGSFGPLDWIPGWRHADSNDPTLAKLNVDSNKGGGYKDEMQRKRKQR